MKKKQEKQGGFMIKSFNKRYLFAVVALSLLSLGAQAKDYYRVIQGDGSVMYTDTKPSSGQAILIDPMTGVPRGGITEININILPTPVRNAFKAYPVVLYSSSDCAGCANARTLLTERGIPYIEYTVTTTRDMDEFKNRTSAASFPTITVGSKVLMGYNEKDWNDYLNAAGYPQQNTLPRSYVNPSPRHLTTPQTEESIVSEPVYIDLRNTTPVPMDDRNPGIRF